MATKFDYDNLPNEMLIDSIPEEFNAQAMDLLDTVLSDGAEIASGFKIARVHSRKGYMDFDALGDPANSWDDDVVIQLTVRMDRHSFETNKGVELENLIVSAKAALNDQEAATLIALQKTADAATAARAEILARIKNRG